MPVLEKQILPQNSVIGIWEITEEVDLLRSNLDLCEEEKTLYSSFANDTRRKHWLSYRNLLKELIPNEKRTPLIYDENGKPFFTGKSHFLSVSHTGSVSAAIVSSDRPVGIDIEAIHPRIEKVVHKFLSKSEQDFIHKDYRLEMLYVFWSAKEALYKMYGKRNLLFIENLQIEPFDYCTSGGEFTGNIVLKNKILRFQLHYRKFQEYMLVYVVDTDNSLNL